MRLDRFYTVQRLFTLPCVSVIVALGLAAQAKAAINCIRPPAISNPVTYTNKCPEDRGGPRTVSARNRDVYIELPKNRTCSKSITVSYARNVRITGGHIVYNDNKPAVINVGWTSGTTFVDGLMIDVNKRYADAIRVYRHKGRLIVQNTHIKGVGGTVNGIHGDITHAQGGGPLNFLALQNVTGLTGYQGLFTPYQPAWQSGTRKLRLHRVNVAYDPGLSKSSGARKPLKLLFFGSADSGSDRVPDRGTNLNNVFVDGSYWNWPYHKAVYAEPRPGSGGCASFDGKHKISGRVCNGRPKSGDFAKASMVGRNYNRARFCRQ